MRNFVDSIPPGAFVKRPPEIFPCVTSSVPQNLDTHFYTSLCASAHINSQSLLNLADHLCAQQILRVCHKERRDRLVVVEYIGL